MSLRRVSEGACGTVWCRIGAIRGQRRGYLGRQAGFGGVAETRGTGQGQEPGHPLAPDPSAEYPPTIPSARPKAAAASKSPSTNPPATASTSTAAATATPAWSSWPAIPPRPTSITNPCWSPANPKSANTAPPTSSAECKPAARDGRHARLRVRLFPSTYLTVGSRAQSHQNVGFRLEHESNPQPWRERNWAGFARLSEP